MHACAWREADATLWSARQWLGLRRWLTSRLLLESAIWNRRSALPPPHTLTDILLRPSTRSLTTELGALHLPYTNMEISFSPFLYNSENSPPHSPSQQWELSLLPSPTKIGALPPALPYAIAEPLPPPIHLLPRLAMPLLSTLPPLSGSWMGRWWRLTLSCNSRLTNYTRSSSTPRLQVGAVTRHTWSWGQWSGAHVKGWVFTQCTATDV